MCLRSTWSVVLFKSVMALLFCYVDGLPIAACEILKSSVIIFLSISLKFCSRLLYMFRFLDVRLGRQTHRYIIDDLALFFIIQTFFV